MLWAQVEGKKNATFYFMKAEIQENSAIQRDELGSLGYFRGTIILSKNKRPFPPLSYPSYNGRQKFQENINQQ